MEKLGHMVITWHQPWYQQSNCLTRPFKENNVENSDDYRKDSFTKDESDLIAKRWKKFCKVNRLNISNIPKYVCRLRILYFHLM